MIKYTDYELRKLSGNKLSNYDLGYMHACYDMLHNWITPKEEDAYEPDILLEAFCRDYENVCKLLKIKETENNLPGTWRWSRYAVTEDGEEFEVDDDGNRIN